MRSSARRVVGMVGVVSACFGAACGGAASEADAPPEVTAPPAKLPPPGGPLAELAQGYASANGLELLTTGAELLPSRPAGRPARAAPAGLGPEEAVLEDEAGELFFVAPKVEWYCEPAPRAAYRIARAKDGGVVILRLDPKITVVKKHIAGACGVGCGPAPPPPQTPRFKLPKTEHVSIVSVPYDVTVEQTTCDQPMPRP